MSQLPVRTGESELTDDELLFFDFMWDCYVPFRFFDQQQYSVHMNCLYTHQIDSADVAAALQSLLTRKLIQSESDTYTLTPTGGLLWELERRPDWDLFVSTLSSWNPRRFRIVAMQESIGGQYIAAIGESNLITLTSTIRSRRLVRYSLPWRTISPAVMLVVETTGDENHTFIDWEHYESKRTWWRNIRELDSLNRRIAG